MPIYRNNQQVNKVYQGATEISKVYRNNSLIYQKAAPKIDKILIHDFGGKEYYPNGYTHGEWTTRKHTWFSSYYTMTLSQGVVKPFRMPFNATNATLLVEYSVVGGYPKVRFGLSNNPTYDTTNHNDNGVELTTIQYDSTFWKNNQNFYGIKELDLVTESGTVPSYPNTKYLYRRQTRKDNGQAIEEPGFNRWEYTNGMQDTYLLAFMFVITNSQFNNNTQNKIKIGKVYLDLTTDPQYQTYLNS